MKLDIALLREVVELGTLHPDIDQVVRIGDLNISSPYIVACDPIVDPEAPLFNQEVPTGSFPVYAYICEDTNAYIVVKFSKTRSKTWKMALSEDQRIEDLKEDEVYGFGTDTGLAILMSQEAQKHYLDDFAAVEEAGGDYYEDVIDPLIYAESDEKPNPANYTPNKSADNVLIFESGLGDGFYPAYFGYDAEGNVVSFVIDFCILELDESGKPSTDFNPN